MFLLTFFSLLCLFSFQSGPISAPSAPATATVTVEDPNEVVDETGLDAEEIQTVMTQAGVSRAKAAKALRKNKNIVDAILELTP